MRRRWVRAAVGLLLLVLAVGMAFVSHGVAEAAGAFHHTQAQWQRGLAEEPAAAPGPAQRAGETLLGIRGRSEVLRAYQNYRAGLADVIPGTVFPQTRARSEAIENLRRLTSSLASNEDRANAEVVLGVIFAASASSAGKQRDVQLGHAMDAFRRALLEDPANATAKLDLEVLLRAELDKERDRSLAQARASSSPNRRRQRQQNPRGPTIPARAEGAGY